MVDTPLLELEESWVFGMLWPKRLLIFEDRIEARSTELLQETVETIRYSEIKGVVATGSGWSASVLIKRTGKPILLRGVDDSVSRNAKTLIEDRISQTAIPIPRNLDKENLIRKLAELRDAGVLSPEEFEAKRKNIDEK